MDRTTAPDLGGLWEVVVVGVGGRWRSLDGCGRVEVCSCSTRVRARTDVSFPAPCA